jgi:hypothetical protein
MTVAYRTSVFGGTAVDDTNATATITPVLGDLLVAFQVETGTAPFQSGAPGVSDNNPDGKGVAITGWIRNVQRSWDGSNAFITTWIRSALVGNITSTTVTFPFTASSTTSNEVVLVAISGMSVAGTQAILKNASNNAGAGVATVTFASAPLTANMIITALGDLTNPPGLTAPTSFTNRQNVGNAQPAGLIVATVDSGVTATAITWGTNPATNWGGVAIELDGLAVAAVYQDLALHGLTRGDIGSPPLYQNVTGGVASGNVGAVGSGVGSAFISVSGLAVIYRMRAFDTTLATFVYWDALEIDVGGLRYTGPGPLTNVVVSNILPR